MNMSMTAREIVYRYVHTLWDERRPELIYELCADPIVRHYSGKRVEMTHKEQIARIEGLADKKFKFEDVVWHDDGTFVTHVWNAVGDGGKQVWSGTEVFKVVDGRITEVWNAPYGEAHWE